MVGNCAARVVKVRLVVGPETQFAVWSRSAGCGCKKVRAKYPVLVVPYLRPRVREKYEDFGRENADRQRFQKKPTFSLDKMKVRKLRAIAFAECSFDSIADYINSDADFFGISLGKCGQEVPVTASEFPCDLRWDGQDSIEVHSQCISTLLHPSSVLQRSQLGCLPGEIARHGSGPSLCDSMDIISTLISAGFTPLIRLACPSVNGLQADNFCALSFLNPLTER
jgi:hypothetical protein